MTSAPYKRRRWLLIATVALMAQAIVIPFASAQPAVARPLRMDEPGLDPRIASSDASYVTGTYGSAIGMDSLNNVQIGGPNRQASSYRFRASTSSALTSIRIYIMGPNASGYGAGTGGTFEVTVRGDASGHRPGSRSIARTTFRPTSSGLVSVSFRSPARLRAGHLYHLLFKNIDPRPTSNYASLNGVHMFQPTVPREPRYNNVDWGQTIRRGSSAFVESKSIVPILQLAYANGKRAGMGYIESWVRSYKSISGTAKAREHFTPRSTRRVSQSHVRLMRISGSSPLILRLETSGGSLVRQCTVAASAIAIGTPGHHGGSGHATWEGCSFAAVLLHAGSAYNLVVSTAAGTTYSIFTIREGSSHGYSPSTFFGDGYAQYTSGSSWSGFGGGPVNEGDLQFYLR